MLPEVGGLEYVVIAVVALIVVGPKDLPIMLRKVGQFVGKLRGMAAEFRASFDEMARQSELDDLRKEVEAMRRGQLLDQASHDATHVEVGQIFNDINDSLKGGGGFDSDQATMRPLAQTAEIETPEPTVAEAKPRARRKPADPTVAEVKTPRAKSAPKPAAAKATPPKTKAAAATSATPRKVAAKAPAKRAAKPKTGTVS